MALELRGGWHAGASIAVCGRGRRQVALHTAVGMALKEGISTAVGAAAGRRFHSCGEGRNQAGLQL